VYLCVLSVKRVYLCVLSVKRVYLCVQVKSFVSSADDLMKWLEDFRRKLQWCTPLGALPDSARVQLKKLMVTCLHICTSKVYVAHCYFCLVTILQGELGSFGFTSGPCPPCTPVKNRWD